MQLRERAMLIPQLVCRGRLIRLTGPGLGFGGQHLHQLQA